MIRCETGDAKQEYLRSKEAIFLTVTISSGVVNADANGDKILRPGTVLGKVTSPIPCSGSFGPYDPNATDGRQNPVAILHTWINVRFGHKPVAAVFEAHVLEPKIWWIDGAGTMQQGSVPAAVKTALRNNEYGDIHFHCDPYGTCA